MSSDDALAAYVRATVSTQFHPCGTARMGPADDPMAVLDQHCRLRNIPNLRVVDARPGLASRLTGQVRPGRPHRP
jgi:choline dehydrogenase